MLPILFVDMKHAAIEIPCSDFNDIFSPEFKQHCERLAKECASEIYSIATHAMGDINHGKHIDENHQR